MSMDLELCHDLPKIRLSPPPIQILTQQQQKPSNTAADVVSSEIPQKDNQDGSTSTTETCKTPTSQEYKIRAALCCPDAPRKPRRITVSCKRKLQLQPLADDADGDNGRLQFFEILNRAEVDAFFRSSFELQGTRSSIKRSRTTSVL